VIVIWRLSSLIGGGRPQMPLFALFQAQEHLSRTTNIPQASWIASSREIPKYSSERFECAEPGVTWVTYESIYNRVVKSSQNHLTYNFCTKIKYKFHARTFLSNSVLC
jgi:hypothetical protein